MFTPIAVDQIELDRFKNNLDAVVEFSEGIKRVKASGIFHLLRTFARPFCVDRGANPYIGAHNAALVEGYNKCLDDLMYFEEQYLLESLGKKNIKATFGAKSIAIAKGDLTEEDFNGKR